MSRDRRRDIEGGRREEQKREDLRLDERVASLCALYRDAPGRIGELLADDVDLGRLAAGDLELAAAHLAAIAGEDFARAALTPAPRAPAAPTAPPASPAVQPARAQAPRRRTSPNLRAVVAPPQVDPAAGRPLDDPTLARLLPVVGPGARDVRVHDDDAAHATAAAAGAPAVTIGQDVLLGAGAPTGERRLGLLAHEAAHAVQQAGATGHGEPLPRATEAAEAEARAVHAAVTEARPSPVPLSPSPLAVAAFDEAPATDNERVAALRTATTEGDAAAVQQAWGRLRAGDRSAVGRDRALLVATLTALPGEEARTLLRGLRLPRRDALDAAAAAHTEADFLSGVLHDQRIRDLPALEGALEDVGAFEPYHTQAILGPLLEGPTATPQAKLRLATAPTGAAMLQRAWPDTSPFRILGIAMASTEEAAAAFETNDAFREWCVATPLVLRQVVQGTPAPERWARVMWRGPHSRLVATWFTIDRAFWGPRIQTAFTSPSIDDVLIMSIDDFFRGHAFGALHAAGGAAAIIAVSNACSVSLADRIKTVLGAGIEDAALVDALLADPAVTVDHLFALTADDLAVNGLRRNAGGRRPEVVLQRLAAVPARFVEAYATHGGLRNWVNDTPANLRATVQAVPPEHGWVTAFRRYNQHGFLLEMAADRALARALRPGVINPPEIFAWIVSSVPRPIAIEAHATGLSNLIGDASGIPFEHLRQAFAALYTVPLSRAGQNYVSEYSWFGGSLTETYLAVDPDVDAMGLLFQQYARIPRAQMNLASGITMCAFYTRWKSPWIGSDSWLDGDGNDVAAARRFVSLDTSYYMNDNHILMRGVTAAASDVTASGRTGVSGTAFGTARSVDEQTDLDHPGATLALNLFQNHATHEVGHAVGNRALHRDGFDISGDEWTRQYADWQTGGNATDYKRMLGWTAAMDATRYTITHAGSSVTMDGDDVARFLTKIAEGGTGSVSSHRLKTTFGTVDAAIIALGTDAAIAATELYRTVSQWYPNMPGSTYTLSGIGASARVTYFCTRWGNRYVNFKGDAWRSKVSHYSVSSYREMFAELYTAYYNGRPLPPAIGSKDPRDFFRALDRANPADFRDVGSAGSQAGASESSEMGRTGTGRPPPNPNRRGF